MKFGLRRLFSSAVLKEEIQKQIRRESVLIYSKDYCPHCVSAKKTLAKIQPQATVIELDKISDGADR